MSASEFDIALAKSYDVIGEPLLGGMGKVLHLHHRSWGIDVAMKLPQPEHRDTPEKINKFRQECRRWIDLGIHPNISPCYYVQELAGELCVVSEWADGGNLSTYIKKRGKQAHPLEEDLDILCQTAAGLWYAHSKDLLHLDVKPSNFLITEGGRIKVTDFGISKRVTDARAGAGSGFTPAYRAPEQQGGTVGRYTDVYCWAVSALHLLLGEILWQDGQAAAYAVDLYLDRITCPAELKDLLRWCLKPDPQERPASFTPVLETLVSLRRKNGVRISPRFWEVQVNSADTDNNEALSLITLGELDKAQEKLDTVLNRFRDHQEAAHNKYLCSYLQYPHFSLDKSPIRNIQDGQALLLRAKRYFSTGAYELAQTHINTAKAYAPQDKAIEDLSVRIRGTYIRLGPRILTRFVVPSFHADGKAVKAVYMRFLGNDLISVLQDGRVFRFNGHVNSQILNTNLAGLSRAALSPDGQYLLVGSGLDQESIFSPPPAYANKPRPRTGQIRLFDLRTNQLKLLIMGCPSELTHLSFGEETKLSGKVVIYFKGGRVVQSIPQKLETLFCKEEAFPDNIVGSIPYDGGYLVFSKKLDPRTKAYTDQARLTGAPKKPDQTVDLYLDGDPWNAAQVPGKRYLLSAQRQGGIGVIKANHFMEFETAVRDFFPPAGDSSPFRATTSGSTSTDLGEPLDALCVSPDGTRFAIFRNESVEIRNLPNYDSLPDPLWAVCRFRSVENILQRQQAFQNAEANIQKKIAAIRNSGRMANAQEREYLLQELDSAWKNRDDSYDYILLNASLASVLPIQRIKNILEYTGDAPAILKMVNSVPLDVSGRCTTTADKQITVSLLRTAKDANRVELTFQFIRNSDKKILRKFSTHEFTNRNRSMGFTEDDSFLVLSACTAGNVRYSHRLLLPEWAY